MRFRGKMVMKRRGAGVCRAGSGEERQPTMSVKTAKKKNGRRAASSLKRALMEPARLFTSLTSKMMKGVRAVAR
jgi:hypothetical protein